MVNYKQLLRERLKFYFEVIYGMGKNKLLEDSQNYFIFGSWLSQIESRFDLFPKTPNPKIHSLLFTRPIQNELKTLTSNFIRPALVRGFSTFLRKTNIFFE